MAEQKKQEPTQVINLRIAGEPYKLNLKVSELDKEEVYRLAEREVNAYVSKWKSVYGDKSIQDCLALTALQFCINNISMTRQSELSNEDLDALDALSQRMDKHLNRITPRKNSTKK